MLQAGVMLTDYATLMVAVADVMYSPAVIGTGRAMYDEAVAVGHEGVMAMLLRSVYRPGKRSAAWRKIKPRIREGMDKGVQRQQMPRPISSRGALASPQAIRKNAPIVYNVRPYSGLYF
jgi:hypothetical protein